MRRFLIFGPSSALCICGFVVIFSKTPFRDCITKRKTKKKAKKTPQNSNEVKNCCTPSRVHIEDHPPHHIIMTQHGMIIISMNKTKILMQGFQNYFRNLNSNMNFWAAIKKGHLVKKKLSTIDPFSTSKWPSETQFCERYECSWHRNY